MKKIGIFLLTLSILFLACTEETMRRLEPQPNAVGTIHQLGIICDQELWDSHIGDSLNFYFGSAYPLLPQPEPFFDMKHFTPEDLQAERVRKELKAYLIVTDISDRASPTTKMMENDLGSIILRDAMTDSTINNRIVNDRWARDQILIYLFASGEDRLANLIPRRFPSVSKRISNFYDPQIDATVYQSGINDKMINLLNDSMKVFLKIPEDYFMAVNRKNLAWIRRETDESSSNIIIHRYPYVDQNQLTKDALIEMRNRLGKQLVRSDIEGAYMTTNGVDLPILFRNIDLANSYAVEARGIWEMEGDFMGGPFVTYAVLDQENNDVLFIDSFLHAPGEKKRNNMLYIEHIISSLDLKNHLN